MSGNFTSDNQWGGPLRALGVSNELANSMNELVKDFSHSYNRALESLESLAALPVEVDGDGIRLPHWDAALRPNSGDCVDLAFDLLNAWKSRGIDLRLKQSGVDIYYCEGTEPQFFNRDIDNHAFIGLIARGSEAISVLVDPALQRICPFQNSGYTVRFKIQDPKTQRPPDREIRFTHLPDRALAVVDFLTSDIAVLGLTADRVFGISLGFARYPDLVRPFLVIAKESSRGVIYLECDSNRPTYALSGLGDDTIVKHPELNALGETLMSFRFRPRQK